MKRIVLFLIVAIMITASAGHAFAASGYTVGMDNTVYSPGMYMFISVTTEANEWYSIEILKGDDILVSFSEIENVFAFPILIPASWKSGTDYVFRAGRGTDIASVGFTIEASIPRVAPVIALPSSSTVTAGTRVTLSTDTPDAVIYYTANGTTPSKSSTLYTSAGITISANTTIKAIAVRDGYEDSDVLTQSYVIGNGGGDPPVVDPGGGSPSDGGSSGDVSAPTETDVPGITTPLPPPARYSDVSGQDWFYEAVEFISEKGLMSGTGANKFSPHVTNNRAMIVTMLYRLENQPAVTGSSPFSDVTNGQWYTEPVIWAAGNDIVNGYANGTYGWNDPVTREQAVTILYRYAKSKELDVSAQADLSNYTDMNGISAWALDAMKWAVSEGIIQGRTAATIVPQGTSTRAEIATIFKRYIETFSL